VITIRACAKLRNMVSLSSPSRIRPLKLSTKPFCIGLPGVPAECQARLRAGLELLAHELHAVNLQRQWLAPPDVAIMRKREDGELVPVSDKARRLARTMFLGLMARHRWPRFHRFAMRMDMRMGFAGRWIEPAAAGAAGDHFAWWLHLRLGGRKVALPVRGWGRAREDAFGSRGTGQLRTGALGNTINLVLDDAGRLQVVLNRDLSDAYAASRAAYVPQTGTLGLDFGLRTLFASSAGDLVGRGFLGKLMPLAQAADAEMRRMQRAGLKPRDSARYRTLVVRISGLIETEVNRALNHLVALHRPAGLAVEKLCFRGAGVSRRMNRILNNCGRGAVRKKLGDLHERLGIEIYKVDPAYTSQTCSCCGYVDARQRTGERFSCRFCGTKLHADVNGARNIAQAASGQDAADEAGDQDGCSAPGTSRSRRARRKTTAKASSAPRSTRLKLRALVRRFDERMVDLRAVSKPRARRPGARESARDPRLSNPYWKKHSLLVRAGKSEIQLQPAAFAVGM